MLHFRTFVCNYLDFNYNSPNKCGWTLAEENCVKLKFYLK